MATVTAGMTSAAERVDEGKSGKCSGGSPPGIPPNRVPIVSTGRPNAATAIVPTTSATIDPGMRGDMRRRDDDDRERRRPTSAVAAGDHVAAALRQARASSA